LITRLKLSVEQQALLDEYKREARSQETARET